MIKITKAQLDHIQRYKRKPRTYPGDVVFSYALWSFFIGTVFGIVLVLALT